MLAKGQETNPEATPLAQQPRVEEERSARLETALRHSEKLAMAGRLAASVMHEINNPAQAIGDLVYLLAREADRPDLVRTRAAQIEEQLLRIQYIAGQTLSFFRDQPRSQKKDLVPMVDAALRYHSQLLDEKKIQVRKQMPDQLIGSIFPGDLLQLLSNLIRNSAEALPPGGTLCLRLQTAGTNALITVADDGSGIPVHMRQRLFEAFQTDKGDAGNGLGLWICKKIVEKHQGRIRWRSATAGRYKGTTFSVSLPLDMLPL